MNRPADFEARERIRLDLDSTFLVEAGAGSGKTTSLVGRMLQLIQTGTAIMGEIAAITFTNKASDELRERFRLALEKESSKASGHGVEQERIGQALRQIDQCFIGTIHAFCGMMLRERPIESGLDPSFIELDEDRGKELQAQYWEEYLSKLRLMGQEAELEELLALGVDVVTLRSVYERAALFEDVHIVTDASVQKPDFDRIRYSLFSLVDEAYTYIPSNEPEKGWDVLQKLVRETKRNGRYLDIDEELALMKIARRFERKLSVTQNRLTEKSKAKELIDRFQEWQIKVLFPFLEDWREYLYPKLIQFVLPAVQYCKHKRQEHGVVSFQDLLEKATTMLREYSEVRSYFAKRYRRLLIDEFQDTDPIQAEMMFLLAGGLTETDIKDWRKLTPRDGALFIVGDPKQSIYRFRRADISIYNEVKDKIEASGGELLTLSSNFRSVEAIGRFVNDVFLERFSPIASEEQAAFVPMITQLPDPADEVPQAEHGVRTLTYPKIAGGKHRVAEADAEQIAAYISWACCNGNLRIQEKNAHTGLWIYRDAVPGDFLILLKTKEFLHLYEEYLDRYGIPADTTGSSALYTEMLAFAELAAVLQDTTDSVALLAVLRGMLFGISDRALHAYRSEGHKFSYYRVPALEECSTAAQPVAAALLQLRKYAEWTRQMPALAALIRILEDNGLLTYAVAQEAGATRAGSLLRLIHLLQNNAEASGSWPALSQMLNAAVQGKGPETMSLMAGGTGAVRIMNLHKAKGLEAPVVFLACPCGESDHDAEQYIDRMSVPAEGYFTIKRHSYGFQKELIAQPPGWSAMREKERLFMNAEKDRLLYVAATRTKQLLVISLYPEQPALCPWSPLISGENDEMQELEVIEQAPSPRPIYTGTPQLAELDRNLAERREVIRHASYQQVSVTALTKSTGAAPQWSSEGRGKAFGSLIHHCLEAIGTRVVDMTELEAYIRFEAVQEGVAVEWLPAAVTMVRQMTESELWQRSLKAKQRLYEVPLHLLKRTEVAENGQAEQLYVRGIIDFLFEEEDGWVIVDFKTDVFAPEQEADFVRFYKPQVQVYAREWNETFGYPVKETGLYFLQHQKYVKL